MLLGRLDDSLRGGHHSQINHLEVVARQHHRSYILSNVVDIALDRRHKVTPGATATRATLLDVRTQYLHGSLHRAGCLHHLRQEHLALAKEPSHERHTLHQRALDNLRRRSILRKRLLQVSLQMLLLASLQRRHQSLLQGYCLPILDLHGLLHCSFILLGHCDKSLRCILPAA